jgi:uncharacterized protein
MPEPAFESFSDETLEPFVRGFLHRRISPGGNGLVLTHGAGGNSQTPMLVALAAAFAESGLTVLRCDLPFRQMRPHGPPRPGGAARDREGVRNAIAAMKKIVSGRVFCGGQSSCGRQTTMLAAGEPELISALLLLSYPLHPPHRPEQMRTAHFSQLRTPGLFVQGSRDPFASIEEIASAIKLIPGRTRLLAIEGASHSLAGRSGELPSLASRIVEAFLQFV